MADPNVKQVQGSATGTPLNSTLTTAAGVPVGTNAAPLPATNVGVGVVVATAALNSVQYPADLNNASHPSINALARHDGANWWADQCNTENTLLTSQAKVASFNLDDTNNNQRGLILYVNVTAVTGTTPTLDVKLQQKDPVSGNFFDIVGASLATINATGLKVLQIYPGLTPAANLVINGILSRSYRVVCTIGGTTPSFTMSVGVSKIN